MLLLSYLLLLVHPPYLTTFNYLPNYFIFSEFPTMTYILIFSIFLYITLYSLSTSHFTLFLLLYNLIPIYPTSFNHVQIYSIFLQLSHDNININILYTHLLYSCLNQLYFFHSLFNTPSLPLHSTLFLHLCYY